MVSRRGLGKTKHIDTVWLWAQEAMDRFKVSLKKKHTDEMIADLLTKFLSRDKVQRLSTLVGFRPRDGQHPLALGA